MEIQSAKFVTSSVELSGCPEPNLPEYCFIGRSNVGKSSLINYITDRKKLAKTSATPGKTQLINHFIINKTWYLVDLPGYGYAKRSKADRNTWQKFIQSYLAKRANLLCVFVLLDCRHAPQKIDLEFMGWLGEMRIPFNMIFTKIDKLSSANLTKNLNHYQTEMLKQWESLPTIFKSSAEHKLGRQEILNFVSATNPLFSVST